MPSFASLFRHDVPFVVFVFVASPCCAECEWAVCEAANKVNVWNGEHNAWCWMLHEAGSFQPSWVPLIESLSSPKLHNAARNSRRQYVPDRRLCLPKRPWWQNKGLQQCIYFKFTVSFWRGSHLLLFPLPFPRRFCLCVYGFLHCGFGMNV